MRTTAVLTVLIAAGVPSPGTLAAIVVPVIALIVIAAIGWRND